MNDPFPRGVPPHARPGDRGGLARIWRQDDGALAAGVCAGLAEDLDLPLPLVRIVTVVFLLLPTGLAYFALALLLRRRQPTRARGRTGTGFADTRQGAASPTTPAGRDWALVRQRFEMLEPRLKNIEAFVTSSDFELHRGFRRMGG